MRSSVPLYWRLRKSKYRLIGTKCSTCGSIYFPPRPVCLKCRKRGNLSEYQLSHSGKILSWTVIHIPPEGFEEQAPYVIAIIELDDGIRIPGQIINPETIDIGKKVKAVFRKIYEDDQSGLIHYGLKWQIE
jgi:uncharacterized OB-fold protein